MQKVIGILQSTFLGFNSDGQNFKSCDQIFLLRNTIKHIIIWLQESMTVRLRKFGLNILPREQTYIFERSMNYVPEVVFTIFCSNQNIEHFPTSNFQASLVLAINNMSISMFSLISTKMDFFN